MDIKKVMSDSGYDYLIKMPIYNLTQERIDELMKEKDDVESKYDYIKHITVEKIWLGELKALETQYQKFLKQKELATQEEKSSKKKVVKKKKK